MANSETKMKNFVGLSRQYYWVPDAQKSTASSPNPLGSISINLSLFSKKAQSLLSALGASHVKFWGAVGLSSPPIVITRGAPKDGI